MCTQTGIVSCSSCYITQKSSTLCILQPPTHSNTCSGTITSSAVLADNCSCIQVTGELAGCYGAPIAYPTEENCIFSPARVTTLFPNSTADVACWHCCCCCTAESSVFVIQLRIRRLLRCIGTCIFVLTLPTEHSG